MALTLIFICVNIAHDGFIRVITSLLIVFEATIYSVKYSFMIYFDVFLIWIATPKLFSEAGEDRCIF